MPVPPPIKPATPLRDTYVPYEERESQKVNWKPFAFEAAKFIILTKLAALAGLLVGKKMGMQTIEMGPLKTNHGATIGGILGATYEGYSHWRKTEGKRLGVQDISKDLATALDPAQLERETKKQSALVEKLQQLKAARSSSYVEDVAANRETDQEISR